MSGRARGGNRGGCGGGFERTSETYNSDKLRRLRKEYQELDPQWRPRFLESLSRFEQAFVKNPNLEVPYE